MVDDRPLDGPRTEATLDPSQPLGTPVATDARRLAALYEIGRQLLEQPNSRQILDAIQRALIAHLAPEHACLLGVSAEGGYIPLAAHNLDLARPLQDWPLSRTVLDRALALGMAVLATDARRDPGFGGVASVQRLQIRSVMCVPIGTPTRGIIYLDNRTDDRSFSREDLRFLTAIGAYAAPLLAREEERERTAAALALSGERLSLLQAELLGHRIVGRSPGLLAAYDVLKRFAAGGARVVLRGETGTGKDVFARAYMATSPRSGAAFVPVPIPTLAPSLVESELFGHVRGAFTEAARDKKGRLELADGGTLFLDEVGDIDPAVQTKLLRFLDSGELVRVGDNQARRVDALVISATNRALEADVEAGRFRADLFARLGHAVEIPPLRHRRDDIPQLIDHFLSTTHRGANKAFSIEAMSSLKAYRWPYNVRELQQVVESCVYLVDREVVEASDLPAHIRDSPPSGSLASAAARGVPVPLRRVVEETERAHILRTLEFTKGNRRKAIELLRMAPETFYKRLESYGLHKKGD